MGADFTARRHPGRPRSLLKTNPAHITSIGSPCLGPAEEAARLNAGLSPLERFGVNTIKKMQKEMDRDALVRVLQKACAGDLRSLSPDQIGRIKATNPTNLHVCLTRWHSCCYELGQLDPVHWSDSYGHFRAIDVGWSAWPWASALSQISCQVSSLLTFLFRKYGHH